MSDDGQWRQLGSIVNAVLMDARSKAIRSGTISQTARSSSRKPIQRSEMPAGQRLGHGFLSEEAFVASRPVQLELPFGISAPSNVFGSAQAPKTARLM